MLSQADRALVGRDPTLRGLPTLLDARATSDLLRAVMGAQTDAPPDIHYLRYKPGTSCLSGARVASAAGIVQFTLKALGEQAEDKLDGARRDPRATVDEAHRIVIRQFPDDGELKGPRWLLGRDTDAARAHLGLDGCRLHVLAYKPERRMVVSALRDGTPVAVIKCYDSTGYGRAMQAHCALATSGLGVPSVAAQHDRRATIVTPWTDGHVLDPAHAPLWQFELVGDELARLHASPLVIPNSTSPGDEWASLVRAAGDVTTWLPDVGATMQRAVTGVGALHRMLAPSLVAIHGDFYANQILVHDRGVTFLDFDELVMGDAHADIALFIAHLESDVLRFAYPAARAQAIRAALLRGYQRTAYVDTERLALRTADALLRLTPHPFRHRMPDWPRLTRRLVARAAEVLDSVQRLSARAVRAATPSTTERELRDDVTLAAAALLLNHDHATRALAERTHTPHVGDVSVIGTCVTRHKPGRRCMIAFDVSIDGHRERWLGKVRAKGADMRSARIQQQLWQAGLRHMAEPLGVVETSRLTLQRAVAGRSCLRALELGTAATVIAHDVTHALRELQTTAVVPERTWTLDDEVQALLERLHALRLVYRDDAAAIADVERSLMQLAEPLRQRTAQSVIHRDFYHDQVVLDRDGCTIVDLDLVAIGDPALDVGNFIGHLIELSWRTPLAARRLNTLADAIVSAAQQLAPDEWDVDAVTRYAFLTLGRLMEIATRHAERRVLLPKLLSQLQAQLQSFALNGVLCATPGLSACAAD